MSAQVRLVVPLGAEPVHRPAEQAELHADLDQQATGRRGASVWKPAIAAAGVVLAAVDRAGNEREPAPLAGQLAAPVAAPGRGSRRGPAPPPSRGPRAHRRCRVARAGRGVRPVEQGLQPGRPSSRQRRRGDRGPCLSHAGGAPPRQWISPSREVRRSALRQQGSSSPSAGRARTPTAVPRRPGASRPAPAAGGGADQALGAQQHASPRRRPSAAARDRRGADLVQRPGQHLRRVAAGGPVVGEHLDEQRDLLARRRAPARSRGNVVPERRRTAAPPGRGAARRGRPRARAPPAPRPRAAGRAPRATARPAGAARAGSTPAARRGRRPACRAAAGCGSRRGRRAAGCGARARSVRDRRHGEAPQPGARRARARERRRRPATTSARGRRPSTHGLRGAARASVRTARARR